MAINMNDPTYGQGVAVVDEEALARLAARGREEALRVALLVKERLESPSFKPPLLPEVAVALTRLAGRPDVPMGEVEATVARDPAVAARVVALANSAAFSRGTPVKSLRLAVARLGLSEVRDVAYRVVAETRLFKVPGYAERMRELLDAAQLAGLMAKEVCLALRFESETAFLCGLLHDVGEAIALGVVAEEARSARREPPPLATVAPAIAEYHAQAGAHACRTWQLPESIARPILHHHRPEACQGHTQMATVLSVADRLLAHAGVGGEARPIDPMAEPLFYRLNLTPPQVAALVARVEAAAKGGAS